MKTLQEKIRDLEGTTLLLYFVTYRERFDPLDQLAEVKSLLQSEIARRLAEYDAGKGEK